MISTEARFIQEILANYVLSHHIVTGSRIFNFVNLMRSCLLVLMNKRKCDDDDDDDKNIVTEEAGLMIKS